MKTFLKRLLAASLSAALLIGCAVSGLVLPVAADPVTDTGENLITNGDFESGWTTTDVVTVDGNNVFKITKSTKLPQNLTLKEALDTNSYYIFRFKAKGGLARIYGQSTMNFTNINSHTVSTTYQNFYNQEDWMQYQTNPFKPTQAFTELDKSLIQLMIASGTGTELYFDDFELIKYYVGMNGVPGSDGEVLPFPYGGTQGINHIFHNFSTNMTLSLENGAWKLSDLATSGVKKVLRTDALHSILVAKKTGRISFRYKGEGASVTVTSANSSNATVTNQKTGEVDGWKTYSADISILTTNYNGTIYLELSGAETIYIDDFFLGELVEAQIEEEDITIEEGKSHQLNATATPTGTPITWTSSDNTIATVVDGVVTGHKAGKVTITASVENGWDDTCEVTVAEKPTIDIAKGEASVIIGETITLEYAAAPEGATVTWESSDETIATVENGVVTGVKVGGPVTITATVVEGVSDTCQVTVTKVPAGTNLITNGDFEGEYWTGATTTNTKIETTGGYGGGSAIHVSGGTGYLPKDLKFKQLLEVDKYYVFRVKVKGGVSKIWGKEIGGFLDINEVADTTMKEKIKTNLIPNKDGWIQYEKVFKATSGYVTQMTAADKDASEGVSWGGGSGKLYLFTNRDGTASDMYYDDFELFEVDADYVASTMNFMPGADGESLPYGITSAFFEKWLTNGLTIDLSKEDGAWEITVPDTEVEEASLYFATLFQDNPFFPVGSEMTFSFRHKGIGAPIEMQPNTATITDEASVDLGNGWIYQRVTFKLVGNLNFAFYFNLPASTTFLMDDLFLGAPSAAPADPIGDFSMEMLGIGIHWPKGVDAIKENADGVRFGTRLYFGAGFPKLNAGGTLQLPYGGEYCDVVSVGTILRRHTTEGDLTLGTEEWIAEAYSSTTNKLKCIKKEGTYIDFAVNMMKGDKVSTETFNARNYDARGYVQFSNGEVIYTTTVTNGIDAYYATQQQ